MQQNDSLMDENLTFEPMRNTLPKTLLIQESLAYVFSRLPHSVFLLQAWSAECVLRYIGLAG